MKATCRLVCRWMEGWHQGRHKAAVIASPTGAVGGSNQVKTVCRLLTKTLINLNLPYDSLLKYFICNQKVVELISQMVKTLL